MKILVPLEVPDESDFMSVKAEAESPEMIRVMEYDYTRSDIKEFSSYWNKFEDEIIKRGLL